MRLVLDKQAHDVLVTVTCGPKQRVPPVLLAIRVGATGKSLTDSLVIVLFDCSQEKGISLFLGHLLLLLLGSGVIISAITLGICH